ncbi:hypothetical protein ACJHX1_25635, partial [Escherichia sp. WS401]|uniref:hypothetical protein n=1 Tax=Escherichia sp. WS401 TaxID=3381990 RepID=UPI00396C327D
PQNDVTLKMPAFEWVHVQLHQQKGMISLSPPTICNSANKPDLPDGKTEQAVRDIAGLERDRSAISEREAALPESVLREPQRVREAVREVARENLLQERLQQMERDMVRDLQKEKTLGGD